MVHQPDIILLVLDTQRADRLSCYGYPLETSPYLDALAADATRFTHAVAPAQWTIPTHASIFTGLYPSQHTMYQMDSMLPAEITPLAQRLRQAGYFTAGFSNNPLIGAVKNGLQRGFHEFTNYNFLGAGMLTFHLNQSGVQTHGVARLRQKLRFLLAELLGYSQYTSLHVLSSLALPFWKTFLRLSGGTKYNNTQRSLAAAAQLLLGRRQTERGQPVFCFINLMGTHVPYDPPPWSIKRFLPGSFDLRSANSLLQQANKVQVDIRNWLAMNLPEEEYKTALDAFYDAEVAGQDAQVGKFIERLRKAGDLNNILLMVVADHGDHLGEKQRINHAFGVYEQLTHVPLLIRDPAADFPRGQALDPFVSTRRLFHTALTAAGAATSEEEALSLAHLKGEPGAVFAEGQSLQWAVQRLEKQAPGLVRAYGYDQPSFSIYSGAYKLIVTGTTNLQLYNVRGDPTESVDLHQQLPEVVEELKRQLETFMAQMRPVAGANVQQEDDPAVIRQLQALGYLE